jgi:hypothetical protein
MYLVEKDVKGFVTQIDGRGTLGELKPFTTRKVNVFDKMEVVGTLLQGDVKLVVFQYGFNGTISGKTYPKAWALLVPEGDVQYG